MQVKIRVYQREDKWYARVIDTFGHLGGAYPSFVSAPSREEVIFKLSEALSKYVSEQRKVDEAEELVIEI